MPITIVDVSKTEVKEPKVFLLSELKCPECGKMELVADFEHNGSDATLNSVGQIRYPEGSDINEPSLRIIRCNNCDFESYTTDEIMEANK